MQQLIIERVLGRLADLQPKVTSVEALELTAEQRESPHFRVCTRAGRELSISLPRGAELHDGDVIALESGVALTVTAAPEDLIEIRPTSARQWAMSANQLGNLHRPVRFLDATMLVPYDHILEHVLADMGVPFERVKRGFVGDRVPAFSGGGAHRHD